MRRAALAQVHLEGGDRPGPLPRSGGHEVDAHAPGAAEVGECATDGVAVPGEVGRVRLVGREPAAEVDLPVVAAEHLVVRRENAHAGTGQQVDLNARAAQRVAADHLLDHPAAGGEVVEEPARQGADGGKHLVRVTGATGGVAQVDDGVAVAGSAVVVLDDDRSHTGARRADPLRGRGDVVDGVQVLPAQGHRHPRAVEQLASGALEGHRPQLGGGAVDRHAELEGHGDLVLGDVPRLDDGGAARHEASDDVEQVGSVEQLLGERSGRRVLQCHDVQPFAHPATDVRRDEVTVVGEHLRPGRHRADEHEVGVDPVEQQRRVEVAVLHRRQPGTVVGQQGVAQAERRHPDHDVVTPGSGGVRREGVGQGGLQLRRSRPSHLLAPILTAACPWCQR